MSSSNLNLRLRSALMATALVQPVSHSDNAKHFWVLCRMVPGQEPPWLKVVEAVLLDFDSATWEGEKPDLVIARRYVAKDGRMVFGWYINIVAKTVKDIERMVSLLETHLETAKPTLTPRPAPRYTEDEAVDEPPPQRTRALPAGQHPANMQAAKPRPASESYPQRPPPANFKPTLRVTKKGKDGQVLEEEMPLPHIHGSDMNTPNQKGKGAWHDGEFHVFGGSAPRKAQ